MLKINVDQQVFVKMNYNTSDKTQLSTAHVSWQHKWT